ncbi:MAG: metallophosphoesterase [Clostridia bacterium]|nr:metallophosphoesterase [Clostridia bacterium]
MKKLIAFGICIVLLMGILPQTLTVFGQEEVTTLIACSDFQPKSGPASGQKTVARILKTLKEESGIKKADGLLFCGDYDFDTYGDESSNKTGVNTVASVFSATVERENMVFVQGNHDALGGSLGMNKSGENDPASGKYGVFVINNDDYMWYNNDQTTIKTTAQNLTDYLNEKIEAGYDRPIFVLSHLPLHYSMRTQVDGDGLYATYLFNAMNEAGKKGLNIFYLYGHDHSNGWDDYLGGAAVYLPKGDHIQIAKKGNRSAFTVETLAFTYMNAGFVGYYNNENGSDDALTMTLFQIKGNEVTVNRYDKDGAHNLKSAGVRNAFKNEKGYDPNTDVYPSPQTVLLTGITEKSPLEEVMTLNRAGKAYTRVTDPATIKDGGQYLLVYSTGSDKIVTPKVVSKSNSAGERVGFDLLKAEGLGGHLACGDYEDYLWTFTEKDGGYTLSRDGKAMTLTRTTDRAITATLEEGEGNIFTLRFAVGGYYFESGSISLNYNARGLINAFTSDPSVFYLYEYAGYPLDVFGGKATVNGQRVLAAHPGSEVTVTLSPLCEGVSLEKWTADGLTLQDDTAATFTFTMPEGAVKLDASYNSHEHRFDCQVAEEAYLKEEGVYYLSCSCGASSKGSEGEATFTLTVESPSEKDPSSVKPEESAPSVEPEESTPEKSPSANAREEKTGDAALFILFGAVGVGVIAVAAVVLIVVLKKKK